MTSLLFIPASAPRTLPSPSICHTPPLLFIWISEFRVSQIRYFGCIPPGFSSSLSVPSCWVHNSTYHKANLRGLKEIFSKTSNAKLHFLSWVLPSMLLPAPSPEDPCPAIPCSGHGHGMDTLPQLCCSMLLRILFKLFLPHRLIEGSPYLTTDVLNSRTRD